MVHSEPRACVVIEGKTFCETHPATPEGVAGALIGIPAVIIMWGVMGFVVAKVCEKGFGIDIDNPLAMIAGMLVPPMIIGVIVLLLS